MCRYIFLTSLRSRIVPLTVAAVSTEEKRRDITPSIALSLVKPPLSRPRCLAPLRGPLRLLLEYSPSLVESPFLPFSLFVSFFLLCLSSSRPPLSLLFRILSPSPFLEGGMRVNCISCICYLGNDLAFSISLLPLSLRLSLSSLPLCLSRLPSYHRVETRLHDRVLVYTCVRTLARGASSSVRGRKIIDLAANLAATDALSGAHLRRLCPLRENRNSCASFCSDTREYIDSSR